MNLIIKSHKYFIDEIIKIVYISKLHFISFQIRKYLYIFIILFKFFILQSFN